MVVDEVIAHELEAMRCAYDALAPLAADARSRAIRWLDEALAPEESTEKEPPAGGFRVFTD